MVVQCCFIHDSDSVVLLVSLADDFAIGYFQMETRGVLLWGSTQLNHVHEKDLANNGNYLPTTAYCRLQQKGEEGEPIDRSNLCARVDF